MSKMFLVTGSTGSTGSKTVKFLLNAGARVRAFVHSEDERSAALAVQGANVVRGDLLDFEAVCPALEGTQGAYFVYPIRPGILQASAYFAQAAKEAGIKIVVNMSQISARREAKSHAAQDHWISEQVFNWSGVPTTHLRPTLFAEWALYWADQQSGFVNSLRRTEVRFCPKFVNKKEPNLPAPPVYRLDVIQPPGRH